MEFYKSNKEMISIEMEIMNSHPDYNLLADGKRFLADEDLLEEHEEEEELDKERYLLKVDDAFIGIIDFIMENPRDKKPWLGLLIIHNDWTQKSFAGKALAIYEELMRSRNIKEVRLGCFTANTTGMKFWERNGFHKVKEISYREKPLWIMEKKLVEELN
ncbi:GNAT family N-acetyltransferase [Bacillus sp. JJ1609]|uniref:GNAT family N-acetyltransferase n=1 Tax=Bacillus sp. JJ1609 TaxID=3122977 RepID=UPI00300005E0